MILILLLIPILVLVSCFHRAKSDKPMKDTSQSIDVSHSVETHSGRTAVSTNTGSSHLEVTHPPSLSGQQPPSIPSMPPSSEDKKDERHRSRRKSQPRKKETNNKKSSSSTKTTQQTHTASISADLLIETMTKGQDSIFDKTTTYERIQHPHQSIKKKKKKGLKTVPTCGDSVTLLEKTQPNSDPLVPETTQEVLTSSTTQRTAEV